MAEVLKQTTPAIPPPRQGKLKKSRSNSKPAGAIMKPSWAFDEADRRQTEDIEDKQKKVAAAQKKATEHAIALEKCKHALPTLLADHTQAVHLKGEDCRNVLRTMGLPCSQGTVSEKQQRILKGLPAYAASQQRAPPVVVAAVVDAAAVPVAMEVAVANPVAHLI